jgi:hypothetical protein
VAVYRIIAAVDFPACTGLCSGYHLIQHEVAVRIEVSALLVPDISKRHSGHVFINDILYDT